MSYYTTQGLMTAADMADLRDLYDLDAGAQEEEAMEAAHVEHADQCPACQEEASQRETGARVALGMDNARRALEASVTQALKYASLPAAIRLELEAGLKDAARALRSI